MSEHILVADDDPDIRTFLEVTLTMAGFEVQMAVDGEDAVDHAVRNHPRLILLDVMMPKLDGIEACARLRSDARTSGIPIIMLTARAQGSDKIQGLQAGADDYITKPFDPDELVARVEATLRRSSEMRTVSPLTGLPGNSRIETEIARRFADREGFALLYADLNHFKPFNDHYGFLRGDEVIRALAQILESAAGRRDEEVFVGHVGGDDFVVLVPDSAAESLAEDVCRSFDKAVPAFYDAEDLERGYIEVANRKGVITRYTPVSVSIGIAATTTGPFEHVSEPVAVATEMKHFAKQQCEGPSNWVMDRRDRAGRSDRGDGQVAASGDGDRHMSQTVPDAAVTPGDPGAPG